MADFGTDLSSFPDVDWSARPTAGPQVVAEAVARRLITPRGQLIGDPDYGMDVRQWIGDSSLSTTSMAAAVETEAEKDERVERAEAGVLREGDALRLALTLTLSSGPFTFVLAVSETGNVKFEVK